MQHYTLKLTQGWQKSSLLLDVRIDRLIFQEIQQHEVFAAHFPSKILLPWK